MSRVPAVALVILVAGCGTASDTTVPPAARTSGAPAAASQPATPPAATSASAFPSDLPPLPSVPFPFARPQPVVEAVFTFAARHPEVLSRIPCFCGCQDRGHRNNDDCFVAARDASGRVTAWEPHGLG